MTERIKRRRIGEQTGVVLSIILCVVLILIAAGVAWRVALWAIPQLAVVVPLWVPQWI